MREPRGIAVEWVTKRLYWTELGQRGSVMASTLQGRMKTTLLRDLGDPMDIIVIPGSRWVYHAEPHSCRR